MADEGQDQHPAPGPFVQHPHGDGTGNPLTFVINVSGSAPVTINFSICTSCTSILATSQPPLAHRHPVSSSPVRSEPRSPMTPTQAMRQDAVFAALRQAPSASPATSLTESDPDAELYQINTQEFVLMPAAPPPGLSLEASSGETVQDSYCPPNKRRKRQEDQ
ncbi:hypothetical protein GALMADRAFT_141198 [Galerina marginata CBS 339.88]|uniref:Uncharacterized protein n=1 Tax=Galerina marginata (strain CBS 339.88) TaxID=685588 RepID=A0A067SVG4_GALM3|nr:hypothetical protein GALMADRAFT_141198 [Galerina marginata CBS 339.88]